MKWKKWLRRFFHFSFLFRTFVSRNYKMKYNERKQVPEWLILKKMG